MRSPFDVITVLNGKTVRMPIKVPTQEDVIFQAFVRETGEKITINGQDIFPITPRDSGDEATILRVPELIGLFWLSISSCIFSRVDEKVGIVHMSKLIKDKSAGRNRTYTVIFSCICHTFIEPSYLSSRRLSPPIYV